MDEADNPAAMAGQRLRIPLGRIGVVLSYLALFATCLFGARAVERAQARPTLIASVESPYNNIQLFREGPQVVMRFDVKHGLVAESRYNPDDLSQLPAVYTRYMTVGLAYARNLDSALEIGAGGGRTAWYHHQLLPGARITSVELDPEVLRLARTYFGIRESTGFHLANADGRLFLDVDRARYDIILIDAYRGASVPFHLATREFYQLAATRLRPGGVIVQNVEPATMMLDAAMRTLGSVMSNVDLYPASGNIVMVGYAGPRRSDVALRATAVARQGQLNARYDLRDLVAERRTLGLGGVTLDPRAPLLTDDFAPVEMLKAIERHNRPWQIRRKGSRQ